MDEIKYKKFVDEVMDLLKKYDFDPEILVAVIEKLKFAIFMESVRTRMQQEKIRNFYDEKTENN